MGENIWLVYLLRDRREREEREMYTWLVHLLEREEKRGEQRDMQENNR